MAQQYLDFRTVAVIGAGVSGVAAAIHLKRAGLDVTVFERNKRAGGIWVFDEQRAKDAAYPSNLPSTGDSPEYAEVSRRFKHDARQDSPMPRDHLINQQRELDLATSFAPPGPCYAALRNNVSTIEMEMTCQAWNPGTAEFVPHHILADYIQAGAMSNGIDECCRFNTRVNEVRKVGQKWELDVSHLKGGDQHVELAGSVEQFDSVVIASGHYHAPNIPSLPGLADWKRAFPNAVQHSKLYRSSAGFEGKNVLLVGAGVSSIDIAKDLGPIARSVYQSSRGGMYDLPSHLLPDNGARIGGVKSFDSLSTENTLDGSIPGTITLQDGRKLCNIHHVILCTGYHVSFPFMKSHHADGVQPEDADDNVLVTNGQQTHNLHKDIWHIEDPTLGFVGRPYHIATFSFFEFQAMALAAVYSGRVPLPPKSAMRKEYRNRIQEKGVGRTFHSLKKEGDEIRYVNDLVKMVGDAGVAMPSHSALWHEAYERRRARQKALFSAVRDPALDQKVMDLVVGC